MKVTVTYKYGEGETLTKGQGEDGLIMILPPTKLRVDYAINGIKMTKTVHINKILKVNNEDK